MKSRLLWFALLLRDFFLVPIVYFIPRDPRKILFGAWGGRQFSDNPKYFLLELLKQKKEFKYYWVGNDVIREHVAEIEGVRFILRGSFSAFWHMLTAKYYVCNIDWREDLGDVPTHGQVIILNLWHGIPYKKIGKCQFNGNGQNIVVKNKFHQIKGLIRFGITVLDLWRYPDASWTSVSSEKMGDIMCCAFPRRFPKERIVRAGLPRNDFLVQNKGNEALKLQIKQKYALLLNLPLEKKWYLYLPTWRHGEGSAFSFMTSDNREKYQKMLQAQEAILIEKQHPIVLKRLNLAGQSQGNLFALSVEQSAQIDLQELLLVSDRLITDYSSCFFDFALLERPCIHFAYDFEEYTQKDSGVEYDLREIAVGPIVETEQELLETMRCSDDDISSKRALKWQEPIAEEAGRASKTLLTEMGL